MPPFDQNKDDMDAYLKRFERYEENLKWPREEWAVHLSAPLRGNRRKCFAIRYKVRQLFDEVDSVIKSRGKF